MKLVYENMEHIVTFEEGYVNELIVENKKIFSEMVNSMFFQMDGSEGGFVLSIQNKPVEFSKYADVIIQFSPFNLNRKSLLNKLYMSLEKASLQAENYIKTTELLGNLEAYVLNLAEELPFEIDCKTSKNENFLCFY